MRDSKNASSAAAGCAVIAATQNRSTMAMRFGAAGCRWRAAVNTGVIPGGRNGQAGTPEGGRNFQLLPEILTHAGCSAPE